MPSRLGDPMQKIMFVDQHWVRVDGGRGSAEHLGDVVYLVMSLRNVASGIGVLQGWAVAAGLQLPHLVGEGLLRGLSHRLGHHDSPFGVVAR